MNKVSFYGGFYAVIKTAGMMDSIHNIGRNIAGGAADMTGINSGERARIGSMDMIGINSGQRARIGSTIGSGIGSAIGAGADYLTRNPLKNNVGSGANNSMQAPKAPPTGFVDSMRNSAQQRYMGSQGQIDFGNKVLDQGMGGAVHINNQNKPEIQWGNAAKLIGNKLSDLGGGAWDWAKQNPGLAIGGGAGIMGILWLLHHMMSGSSQQQQSPATQIIMPPANNFAFNKPGLGD